MFPVLLTIGPFTLYTYGASLVAAFFLTSYLAQRASQTLPKRLLAIPGEQIMDLITWLLLGGIIGGRIFYVLLHADVFRYQPLEAFAVWQGGLVWYGGFIGGCVTAALFVQKRQLSFLNLADQLAPFVALGHAIGRLGCFANGCCYGRPTEAWYGVYFPGHPHAVVPTQLMETVGLCAIFFVLFRYQRAGWMVRRGLLTGSYLLLYAILRFVIEFYRGDQDIFWTSFTLQQFISLILGLLGVSLIAQANNKALDHDAT